MGWRHGILIAAMIGLASPAGALPRVATYRGTIVSGTDAAGIFTAPGTNLAGQSFIAQYFYDTADGVRTTTPGVSDSLSLNSFPLPSTDLVARLTINGHDFQFAINNANIFIENDVVFHLAKQFSDGTGRPYTYLLNNAVEATFANPSLDADVTGHDPSLRLGAFLIANGFGQVPDATGTFGDTTVTIGSAVPEPGAWAMIVAGFAFTGVAVRRSRKPRRQQPA